MRKERKTNMSDERKKTSGSQPRGSSASSGKKPSSSAGTKKTASSSGGTKKTTTSAGGAKKTTSSSGGTRKTTSSAGSAKKTTTTSGAAKKTTASGTARKPAPTGASGRGSSVSGTRKRAAQNDLPRSPGRDSQAERDLRNSPEARRIQEERRRRTYNRNHRLQNLLFYFAIAVAVLSVVVILSVTVLFNITEVTVKRGDNIPYTDEEIMLACGIEPGDNLFAIDAEQASLDVTTGLPYIEVCKITRKLPSTLELDVRAAIPLGSITTTDGVFIILSASGRALAYAESYTGQPVASINGMSVEFKGIGAPVEIADQSQLDVAAELVVGYSLYGLTLDSITFERSGSVSAGYDGRVKINIGVPTDLSQKVQVSASMIAEGKIARNESGILDLSVDNRAVFTPDYLLGDE